MLVRSFMTLVSVTVLAVATGWSQDKSETKKEDSNSEKILGIWEMQDADLAKIDGKATFEFKKEGTAKMSVEIGKQKPILIEGTYKLDGEKLTLTAKKGAKDETETISIKSISATELVLLDKQNKEVRLKKPEPKSPAKEPSPKSPFPKDLFPKEP